MIENGEVKKQALDGSDQYANEGAQGRCDGRDEI